MKLSIINNQSIDEKDIKKYGNRFNEINNGGIKVIDIKKAKSALKDFLESYKNENHIKYKLKIIHTYHVAEKAKAIAEKLNLEKEDILLAELIGLLHDIGRFEELKITNELDSAKFDHATLGSKMLFESGLIRKFVEEDIYDEIIKKAIENHSRLAIEEGLDEETLLHSKIIRDADKLDNFRVKKEEKIEELFPGKVNKQEDMENSTISNKVYESIINEKCVDVHDRVTYLDSYVCVLAFVFDLNFDVSYKIIEENKYIDILIDRFDYKDKETKQRMERIRETINKFVYKKVEV